MDLPRTPSPPPPPPSPPEVLEPMDLSSDRPLYPQMSRDQSPIQNGESPAPNPAADGSPDSGAMRQNQVGTALLRGVPIVSLYIDNQERLCLAQISNTLLKDYSYNEIHNRRVALGITCVQCTPVQLEILRRTGAMPISSRRCGMITKREAERLVKSFLEEHAPPKLPENFAFKVRHTCGWGCKGSFLPSRYNSSRAKCIKCSYCGLFFSPNKFIFHFHRSPDAKYRHPDAANFNSWRRHLDLDHSPASEELIHAWEDVKAMFNGGSRKRLLPSHSPTKTAPTERRPRLSLAGARQNLPPKIAPQAACPGFPPTNPPTASGAPNNNNNGNFFPQHPPYGAQFPLMAAAAAAATNNEVDNVPSVDGRRMCFPDLWRPKNGPVSYYNPLGLMWAKNFGLYPSVPPPLPPRTANKQEMLRDSVFRMSGMLVDMNGNKPAVLDPPKPARNRSGTRSSAFRPVGNFTSQCSPLSPANMDVNLPVFPRPAMSTSSERSDEFSEPLADVDEDDVDDDEDVDVDVGDARDGESENDMSTYNDVTSGIVESRQQQQRQEETGGATVKESETTTGTRKRDHVTSFSIDSIFDTKKEDSHHISVENKAPLQREVTQPTPGSPTRESASVKSECISQPEGLSYILNLSKEQLQSELLKLMENREKCVGISHQTAYD